MNITNKKLWNIFLKSKRPKLKVKWQFLIVICSEVLFNICKIKFDLKIDVTQNALF